VSALGRTLALLAPSRARMAAAVAFGSLALGSAVALTALSAWLISRAAQHPSIVALSLAVVGVRALGIARGTFRYLERLASHDVALRVTARLRERLYVSLAAADRTVVAGLRHGDLLARIGPDGDLVGDVLVRGLLPFAVAAVVCAGAVTLVATLLPLAGVVLAGCLLVAATLSPWLAGVAARRAHRVADETSGRTTALALELLDHATELTVTGQVSQRLQALGRNEIVRSDALDDAARPGAWAAAASSTATGAALVGCLVVGATAVRAGSLPPVMLAVVVLTPLAMVEVVAALPAAASAVARASAAAQRLWPLLTAPAITSRVSASANVPDDDARLTARGLACGWPGRPPVVSGLDVDVVPGRVLSITGPSGCGKSTLLLTLAGLLPPLAGQVRLGDSALEDLEPHAVRRVVTFTAEDAHLFTTTLRENLLVARGDATDGELESALRQVGLRAWRAGLSLGLDTMLEPGVVSGGERRRLLLARALLVGSRVLLLDEPAEHLDAASAEALMAELERLASSTGVAVAVVTHQPHPTSGGTLLLGSAGPAVQVRHGSPAVAGGAAPDPLEVEVGVRQQLDGERGGGRGVQVAAVQVTRSAHGQG